MWYWRQYTRSQPRQHNIATEVLVSSSLSRRSNSMKQHCLSFNIKVLNKAKYSLPWIKARTQTTKHATIRMLLWQDIAVLPDTVVLSLQLAWSYFAISQEYECYSHCLPRALKKAVRDWTLDPSQVCSMSFLTLRQSLFSLSMTTLDRKIISILSYS